MARILIGRTLSSTTDSVAALNASGTQLDGHSVTVGATTDADTASTVIGRLKKLVALLAGRLPTSLVGGRLDANLGTWLGSSSPTVGSKTSANSLPVVVASDQGAIPVSAATLPLPSGAATEATLALVKAKTDNLDVALSTRSVTGLTDAQLRASALPISGTVTAAQGTQNAGGEASWFARDDYDTQESLIDQVGADAVLTFAFASTKVCMAIVTSQGASLVARATAGATDTPSATKGQPCFDGASTYLPVRCTAVKVFAPVGTTVSVVGLIRT